MAKADPSKSSEPVTSPVSEGERDAPPSDALQTLVDEALDGLVVADAAGTVLLANPAAAAILGQPRESLVGSRFGFPVSADEPSELTVLRPDGERTLVELRATELRWQGQPARLASLRDVTERRQVESDLRRIQWMLTGDLEEEQDDAPLSGGQGYGDLVELNQGGVVLGAVGRDRLADIAGDYVDLLGTSAAVYERNGDYAHGIFTSSWCRLLDRASRGLCDTADNAAALASGRWLCHESCWTDCAREAIATGAPVDRPCHGGIRLFTVPIRAGAEVVGAMNVGYGDPPTDPDTIREIAARYRLAPERLEVAARQYASRPPFIVKLAHKRLLASARLIGALVESHQQQGQIRELERQYHQSQRMETVGRLAGGVAHDFNNLLTLINSYATLILGSVHEADPMREDAQQILDAGNRAAALTRQLLAFSRKQVMEPRVLELNDVVTPLEKMLNRLIGEDVELEIVLAEALSPVKADPSQLEQVLMNLVVNARDAMPRGGRIAIETADVELGPTDPRRPADCAPGPHVLLAVSDSGEGMDAETRDRIFEPFFTTKEQSKGTGLGLAMVYGIVKQSGGSIHVESAPGQGAVFRLFFPLSEADRDRQERDSEPALARGDETVLVVEDEDAVRRLARRILESVGYRVITAANGGEALLQCERHGADIALLLTDVIMPQMSGRELADRLSREYPHLRILFMSGYTDEAISQHGLCEAEVDLLQKPFSAQALLKKVQRVLDRPHR
jgi:signal transduction histidine kinase/ActR/RegA family two-component response regulator